ncbi:DgyrCDS4555 [Dimorphilus gyrociliatus]|uniref:Protein-lysine N-methyltransferase DGYR_LOCUS4320 n=1 Tax=Dimorphilus gyrociliatus TaxID=2664684 RepID=A0A7I8VIS0_9ANNE|nr:DgyrCDS4555 [Dimorphilus gyrociliatus]
MAEPTDTDCKIDKYSSELGQKTFWDSTYKREIENFNINGYTDEIWFGKDSVKRMVDWICENITKLDSSIIDLGCGNGYTLLELRKKNFTNLHGVDYSQWAVDFAKKFAISNNFPDITYTVSDLTEKQADWEKFDIVLDKGTFDAISLCDENVQEKKLWYKNNVESMLKNDSLFIITSCNWTEEELVKFFGMSMYNQ